jgi:hypothetical protein
MRWRWPFGREKMVPVPHVELTEDEINDCNARLKALRETAGESYFIREELAESYQRNIVAQCLMSRAEKFMIMARSQPEYVEEACRAAAKACAFEPLSIHFYDYGCILQRLQRTSDSKLAFREFLRRRETEQPDPVQQIFLDQRDLAEAVSYARQQLE